MPITELSPDQAQALQIARQLAEYGIPLFLAETDPNGVGHNGTGFWLPKAWQQTEPDPSVVDAWAPGQALCAVMGHGLDLIDIDPRNGGSAVALGSAPRSYGVASTPSGGTHNFIASIGVPSQNNVIPGIDVKAGGTDGRGRGFAFLAPTVRKSKVTGEPGTYSWLLPPDLEGLLAAKGTPDEAGIGLANRIRASRALKSPLGTAKSTVDAGWYTSFLRDRPAASAQGAQRAINNKLAEVKAWTIDAGVGFRETLMRAALTMGGYVGSGFLARDEAQAQLEDAVAQIWDSPDADDLLWITQGLDDGEQYPFPTATIEESMAGLADTSETFRGVAEGASSSTDIEALLEPPDEPPTFIHTFVGASYDPAGNPSDLAQGRAAQHFLAPAARYATDAGVWIVRRRPEVWIAWKHPNLPQHLITVCADRMPPGVTPVPKQAEDRDDEHWRAWRLAQYTSTAGINRYANTLQWVAMNDNLQMTSLDANPEILWAGGTPWDLSTCEPASWINPNDPHLHTARCAPNPDVPTPYWDAFLESVWPDPEIRAWSVRVLSVSLTGYPTAVTPMLFGRERSGKTSMVKLTMYVLGTYAHSADVALVSASKNGPAPHQVVDLKGRRLSFIDEGPRPGEVATERLKQLTGGGPLNGAAKYLSAITFDPTHTLIMTMNNEPSLTDPALRARARLIPCDSLEDIVRPAREALTDRILAREAPGILAKLMREAAAWLADRHSASTERGPLGIRGLAEDIARSQDAVREWIDECMVYSEPGMPAEDLWRLFNRWIDAHPMHRRGGPWSMTKFGRNLTDKYGTPHKVHGLHHRPLVPRPYTFGGSTPTPLSGRYVIKAPGEGLGSVGGEFGSQPSPPENTRSTQVFTPTGGGLEGLPSRGEKKVESREEKDIRRGIEKFSETIPPTLQTLPQPGLTCDERVGGSDSQPSKASPTSDPDRFEVAARATADGIPKPEARRRLKAEARRALFVQRSGPLESLPAVVARSGAVLGLTLEQAVTTVRACLARTGALTVDVEHSGYPIGHVNYALRTVQLGDSSSAVVFDATDAGQAELIRVLLAEAPQLIAHSATADLIPLAVAGLIDHESGWSRMFDTVILAKLSDPALADSAPGLKRLAPAVLDGSAVSPAADHARADVFSAGGWLEKVMLDTPPERSGWAQIDPHCTTMITYAASDVLDTAAIAERLSQPVAHVLERERLTQQITAQITYRGVALDYEHVCALDETHTTATLAAAQTIQAFGIDKPGSAPQVGEKLLELGAELPVTPTGKPSASAEALAPMRAADGDLGELVRARLSYMEHAKVLSTYVRPYRQLCEYGDGRVRPTIYTLEADTGRMSSVRPNIMNQPRQGGIRACLVGDPGQLLISADFSQVELRVAAALSGDQTVIDMLASGVDLHWQVARQAFGESATYEDRAMVKRGVFGRIYGGGIPTLAREVGVTEQTMAVVVESLDAITPQLIKWSQGWRNAVKAGQDTFTSYSGRVIHLPSARPHKVGNYLIQGTARELLVDALIRWRGTKWGKCVLWPVHDEIDVLVPAEDAQEATEALVACMQCHLGGIEIKADPREPTFAWADSS